MTDPQGRAVTVRPVEGRAVTVVLPDVRGVLWWGPDDRGVDVVAAADGRPLIWTAADECLRDVGARGWPAADDEPTVLDLRPVAAWLQGRRLVLDATAALNTWNLAGDLAATVGVPWSDRGRLADVCFDKLTMANVPWLAGPDRYRPRWTGRQHTYLRHRLAEAVAVVRRQLLLGCSWAGADRPSSRPMATDPANPSRQTAAAIFRRTPGSCAAPWPSSSPGSTRNGHPTDLTRALGSGHP